MPISAQPFAAGPMPRTTTPRARMRGRPPTERIPPRPSRRRPTRPGRARPAHEPPRRQPPSATRTTAGRAAAPGASPWTHRVSAATSELGAVDRGHAPLARDADQAWRAVASGRPGARRHGDGRAASHPARTRDRRTPRPGPESSVAGGGQQRRAGEAEQGERRVEALDGPRDRGGRRAIAGGAVVQGPVRLDMPQRGAVRPGEPGDGRDLVQDARLDVVRRQIHRPAAEPGEVRIPGMRADGDAVLIASAMVRSIVPAGSPACAPRCRR